MEYYLSSGMYWYLDQTEDLYSASRRSHMVLSGFFISVERIHDELDAIFQELPECISQE